jgi:hypothetical protein
MMPIVYSHRGNLEGPNPSKENLPEYIYKALAEDFKVEIDLRVKGGSLYLGHDEPQYPVSWTWLSNRSGRLLVHVKDLNAIRIESALWDSFHCFCHVGDPFTITSWGQMWIHDLTLPWAADSIIPLITTDQIKQFLSRAQTEHVHGICTDFPRLAK